MSIRKRLLIIMSVVGLVAAVVVTSAIYVQSKQSVVADAKKTGETLMSRAVEMFMVSTKKYWDQHQAATTDEERQKVHDDWMRSIEAVDIAVTNDFGEGKDRVRLIGDEKIFKYKPFGGDAVAIKNDFERRASEQIMAGAPMVEENDGSVIRIAVPLPANAHAGCSQCHVGNPDNKDILGTLNVYLPLEERMAEARQDLLLSAGVVVLCLGLALATILYFINRRIINPVDQIASSVSDGVQVFTEVTNRMTNSSIQMNQVAQGQTDSTEETANAINSIADVTERSLGSAESANQQASQALHAAEQGTEVMKELNTAMDSISESSDKVSKIINVIEEIAFQTNLLALNAAVEAARAGEHGKGFAVVADEVRNLAGRAAEAARDTAGLIDESVANAQKGVDVSGAVSQTLEEIADNSKQVSEIVDSITTNTREQQQGVNQIKDAMNGINHAVQEISTQSDETAAGAEEFRAQVEALNQSAKELRSMIRGYQMN